MGQVPLSVKERIQAMPEGESAFVRRAVLALLSGKPSGMRSKIRRGPKGRKRGAKKTIRF